MEFKWFNRPSVYFKANPDLLRDKLVVDSFLEELDDLYMQIFDSRISKDSLLILLQAEVRWLKENRQDNLINCI